MAAHVLDPYYLSITVLITIGYQLSGFAIAWSLQFDKITGTLAVSPALSLLSDLRPPISYPLHRFTGGMSSSTPRVSPTQVILPQQVPMFLYSVSLSISALTADCAQLIDNVATQLSSLFSWTNLSVLGISLQVSLLCFGRSD
jgi:hypothetical protein